MPLVVHYTFDRKTITSRVTLGYPNVNLRLVGCSRQHMFSLSASANCTKSDPGTNRPIECSLCPEDSVTKRRPVHWKYNLKQHIEDSHGHITVIPTTLLQDKEISEAEIKAVVHADFSLLSGKRKGATEAGEERTEGRKKLRK